METDFTLRNEGSIALLKPETAWARTWIDDNIGEDNGYQPYYPTVVIEHRYLHDIVEGLQADGLSVAE